MLSNYAHERSRFFNIGATKPTRAQENLRKWRKIIKLNLIDKKKHTTLAASMQEQFLWYPMFYFIHLIFGKRKVSLNTSLMYYVNFLRDRELLPFLTDGAMVAVDHRDQHHQHSPFLFSISSSSSSSPSSSSWSSSSSSLSSSSASSSSSSASS